MMVTSPLFVVPSQDSSLRDYGVSIECGSGYSYIIRTYITFIHPFDTDVNQGLMNYDKRLCVIV